MRLKTLEPIVRRRLAIGWLAVAIALSLASLANSTRRSPSDFAAWYSAGVAIQRGQDPYSASTICAIERAVAAVGNGCIPYPYPPTFTAFMLPFSYLGVHAADYLFVALMLACAGVFAVLAIRLAQVPARLSFLCAALTAAGILVFAPIKYSLGLGAPEALCGMLALAGLLMSKTRPVSGGAIAVLGAFLKPQSAALAVIAYIVRRPRALLGAAAATIGVAAGLGILAITGHATGTVDGWYRAAVAIRAQPSWPLIALQLSLAVAAAGWLLAQMRRGDVGFVEAFSIAAAFNVMLASLIHMQPYSATLLILPLLVVVRVSVVSPGPIPLQIAVPLGIVSGLLSGDALFAVSHYSGWTHAILPWVTVASFGIAVVLLKPAFRWIVVTGLLTNLLVTFPPFAPPAQTEFVAAAGFGLLILFGKSLARERSAGSVGLGGSAGIRLEVPAYSMAE